jgi:heat shock protein HslJ
MTHERPRWRRMRAAAASIAALCCALALASCTPTGDHGGPDPQLRGQWELQSAKDATGTIPLKNQLITLTINGDDTTTGRSTCSDYRAKVFGSVGPLWITATLPKVQDCGTQAQQNIEERYINVLNQVRFASITGGLLDLTAPHLSLHFQRALAIPMTLVTDRNWLLTYVAPDSYYNFGLSREPPFPVSGATLRFDKDGTMSGTTWCTTFTANYVQNAGEIVLSKLRKQPTSGCTQDQEGVDSYVMRVMAAGFTFLSGDGQLQLSSPRAELELGFVLNLDTDSSQAGG